MTRERLLELLNELLVTHSPVGDEAEIDAVLAPHFDRYCDQTRVVCGETLVGKIGGRGLAAPVQVLAHKDEIGMIVKRIDRDGRLHLDSLGSAEPWRYGEGPVEILGDHQLVPGVLSVGSYHTTGETERVQQAREQPLQWPMMRVQTGWSLPDLTAAGVHGGSRVVVHRARKQPLLFGDCLGGYGLDDKVSLAVMIAAMQAMAEGQKPRGDVSFLATSAEELCSGSALYVTERTEGETVLALEIGPVAEEYGVKNTASPVIWYRDEIATYTKRLCDELLHLAQALGFGAQPAVYSRAGTDASVARQYGRTGRIACLGFPAENSHGYELASLAGIENLYRLLMAWLCGGE